MRLVTATPGAIYCDTSEPLTDGRISTLLSKGVRGVWRYLSGLSPAELTRILNSPLELYFVNYSRNPGWQPSAQDGAKDAARDLAACAALNIIAGPHIAFDLEGPGGTTQDVIDHVNAHAVGVVKGGHPQMLYVGSGPKLTSKQLYALPYTTLYWHACSRLVDPIDLTLTVEPWCGWAVYQARPPNVILSGDFGGDDVEIDWNGVTEDYQGRLPVGVVGL